VKQKQFQDLLHPEKWEYIAKKEKKERTEDEQNYWLKIKEWRNVVKKLRENDIEIEKLTNELNQIKKDY
jgi:hypothetical protein